MPQKDSAEKAVSPTIGAFQRRSDVKLSGYRKRRSSRELIRSNTSGSRRISVWFRS